ncbi:MAG: DPP IV N-terminal domain-containing protein [Blastocatellia bacterium]
MKQFRRLPVAFFLLLLVTSLAAQQPVRQIDPSQLSLDTIFSYGAKSVGWHQWQADGSGYLMLEPAAKGAVDLVRYDAASGARTVLVAVDKLIPPGAASPLVIEQFDLSQDGRRLLIFTNSERVWRSNTRGDYWVFDVKSAKLQKLGGQMKGLMFAKFSPDAMRVGYVHRNNLYVENLADGQVKQLTSDGTEYIVNGTFDWVYEEELFCRDGWRWSPDGRQIAYWQLDSAGVKEFKMINNTDELYPKIISFPYPKAGETNSAARVGVVSATGGKTRWFEVPGDAQQNYLPRMEWAANSDEVVIQQLNRLQNTNIVMLGDTRSGKVRPILTERDDTWVDTAWGSLDWDSHGLQRGDVEWIERQTLLVG